jgi:hypothetical protein
MNGANVAIECWLADGANDAILLFLHCSYMFHLRTSLRAVRSSSAKVSLIDMEWLIAGMRLQILLNCGSINFDLQDLLQDLTTPANSASRFS